MPINKKSINILLLFEYRSSVRNSMHSQFSAASQNDDNIYRDHSLQSSNQKAISRKPSSDDFSDDYDEQMNIEYDNPFSSHKKRKNDQQQDINVLFLKSFQGQGESSQNVHLSSLPKNTQSLQSPQFDPQSASIKQLLKRKHFPYKSIYQQITKLQQKSTLQQIQKQYPTFLITKPIYKLQSSIKQINNKLSNTSLVQKGIKIIDIKCPPQSNRFYLACSCQSNSNCIIIHQLNSSKPLQIVQVFSSVNNNNQRSSSINNNSKLNSNSSIKYVKWSSSMQYLIVSNSNRQVKLFEFRDMTYNQHQHQRYQGHKVKDRQKVTFPSNSSQQTSSSIKFLKQPLQIFTLAYPKIKSSIIQAQFIHSNPVKVLLVDDEYQIYIVEMKKHILNYKPHISKLPIKFNQFYQLKIKQVFDSEKGRMGTIIMVGGEEYVTLAMIEPSFEIILVYDKQKHFINPKKGGFPNISFISPQKSLTMSSSSNNSTQEAQQQIMIAWDKHMEILQLSIQSFQPLTYKLRSRLKYNFPDSSIIIGNISNTIIYQLTRLQLKIYSLNQIQKYNAVTHQSTEPLQPVQTLSSALMNKEFEQALQQNRNTMVKYINGNNKSNTSPNTVQKQIYKFAQPIFAKRILFEEFPDGEKLEETIYNQVIDLNTLRYLQGLICTQLNTNTLFILQTPSTLYQLSLQSFPDLIQTTIQSINDWKLGLQMLTDGILKQITNYDNMQSNLLKKQLKQYTSRYIQFLKGVIPNYQQNHQIWKQQMSFVFNLLIQTNQQKYLMKQILLKLYRISPQLLKIFQTFILLNQIKQIQVDTLDLLFSVIDRSIGRKLIYCIQNNRLKQEQRSGIQYFNTQTSGEMAHLINPILIRYQMWVQLIWVNQFYGDYYTPFAILVAKYEQKYNRKQTQIMRQLQKEHEQNSAAQKQKDKKKQKYAQQEEQAQKNKSSERGKFYRKVVDKDQHQRKEQYQNQNNNDKDESLTKDQDFKQINKMNKADTKISENSKDRVNGSLLSIELIKYRKQKQYMTQLLSYLSYDTFHLINSTNYNKFHHQSQHFHISKIKAKYLLQTLIPLMNQKLNNILIGNCHAQYFDYVMEELFTGNCLEILAELSQESSESRGNATNTSNISIALNNNSSYCRVSNENVLKNVVDNVSFRTVVQSGAQGKYWLWIIRLMIRQVLVKKIIPGIHYLTLEYQYSSTNYDNEMQLQNKQKRQSKQHPNPKNNEVLISLLDTLSKQCYQGLNQQLYSLDKQKKVELFEELKPSEYTGILKILGKQLDREIEVLECLIKIKRCHNVELMQYINELIESNTIKKRALSLVQNKDDSCITDNYNDDYNKNNRHLVKSSQLRIKSNQSNIPASLLHKSKEQQIHKANLHHLKQLLKRHIKLFTSIDPERISSIIISHYKQEMTQFISYLNDNPKQQLNLLKQILIHYNYGQFLNKQKIQYIELLAICNQKSIILDQIKQHMFPLDQTIAICRKYEILQALAFLLVKSGGSGNAKIAIEIYFKVIKEHIEVYKYNRKNKQLYEELKSTTLLELNKCIQICIQLDLKGNYHYQTEWFFIIQQLEQLKHYIYKTCPPQLELSIKSIINQHLYPSLISQLLDQVTQTNLVDYLEKSINQLQINAVQLIIEQMIKSYFYQKQILKNAQLEISINQIQQRKQLVNQTIKGFKTSSRCYECMKKDNQIKIHYYTCGHDIHPACNQDVKQCISCIYDLQAMIVRQINLKDKVEKQIYYNEVNKQLNQKQIIRLSRQEKLKQFDISIEENASISTGNGMMF